MVLVTPAASQEYALRAWLAQDALPTLPERPGILGAHLVEGEPITSGTDTAEKRLRASGNAFVDWVILVAGYHREALAAVGGQTLAEAVLIGRGAASAEVRGIYRLVHCVSEADLPTVPSAA
jgi:hypothetical protein